MASSVNNSTGAPGLLKDVDLARKDWYSDKMSPSVELSEEGHFFEAAKTDAALRNWSVEAYLEEMRSNMIQLLRDADGFDRVSLKADIQDKAATMGSLNFITGSRNIGKTRLLKQIAGEYEEPESEIMLVYVNGRDGNVATGIKKALNNLKDKNWYEKVDWEKIGLVMLSANAAAKPLTKTHPATASGAEAAACGLSRIFNLLKSTGEDEDAELVSLITKLAQEKKKNPCLIIDEANRVAKSSEDTALLAKIIKLTKEELKVSVMLCTSVHSYPGVVQGAFNVEFATSSLAEELSPTVMFDILTTEEKEVGDGKKEKIVGMGPNLARLCVASCGGNLLRVNTSVGQLRNKKVRFTPLDSIYGRLEGAPEIAGLMEDTECKAAVKALAKQGYYETTKKTEALEKKLVGKGVASKVQRDDLMEGSPLLEGYPRAFLIPSSQSLRSYIVETYPEEFK